MVDLVVFATERELSILRDTVAPISDLRLVARADCSDPLDPKVVDGLVLLTAEDKPYWAEAASEVGIPVMATHPLRSLIDEADALGENQLNIISIGGHSKLRTALAEGPFAVGPLAYCEIDLEFDSSARDLKRVDQQAQIALEACDVLLGALGPVDELISWTRNFFHSDPVEDCVRTLLRMRNGVEVQFKLLDYPGMTPKFHLRAYSKQGHYELEDNWVLAAEDLADYFRNFTDCLKGHGKPFYALRDAEASYRLLRWMRASARADAVLNYRELP